jgi:hypothetical protein
LDLAPRDPVGAHLAYDSRRARAELGATFRPAREVLLDTFRWLLFVGALKPKVAAKVRAALGDRAAPDPGWHSASPAGSGSRPYARITESGSPPTS